MAAIRSFLTADTVLSAPKSMRPALLAAAPAEVRREVKTRFRRAWEEYVQALHQKALEGDNRLLPTRSGGVVDRKWWEQRGRPPVLAPWWNGDPR